MGKTSIEWCDTVWNPVTGCDRVSPGCTHCYALTLAKRLKAMGQPHYQRDGANPLTSGPGFGVALHPEALEEPMHWRKPRRVFVCSMADLFHEEVPDEFILQTWLTMAQNQEHTFQVLTKRPDRMLRVLDDLQGLRKGRRLFAEEFWPLPNVWLGVSVESQRWTSRLDVLAKVPAAVRFISAEPLLGPVDFGKSQPFCRQYQDYRAARGVLAGAVSWVIVGGESGPGARPCNIEWVRDIVRQGRKSGVPVFVKQLGSHWARQYRYVYRQQLLLGSNRFHSKGGDPREWPEDLRVREWPRSPALEEATGANGALKVEA